eukprot:SAG25_NODE_482_length_7499_cov_12.630946_2_plen_36_part_00
MTLHREWKMYYREGEKTQSIEAYSIKLTAARGKEK